MQGLPQRAVWLALLAALLLVPAGRAPAQTQPDLTQLALDWARGDYRSPLLCEFGEQPRRGLRRILIAPGPTSAYPRVDRVTFFSLEADGASRCFDALGGDEPDLVGAFFVSLPTRSRSDLATRDFKEALRREGGFSFEIERGELRARGVAEAPETERSVELAGGRAHLRRIEPGSDAARLLADLAGPRKLELVIEAPEGERFRFPLVQTGPR